jgi:hypothetical protein
VPTTTEYKFPYPADADAPDGPKQIKELAEALDKIQWLEAAIKDGAVTSRKLKLSSGILRSSADLALKEAWQTLAGTTLSLPKLIVKSKLIVVTAFQFQCAGEGASVYGTVDVDGKREEDNMCAYGWGASTVQSNFDGLTEVYEFELAPGEHTIALAAKSVKLVGGSTETTANKKCSALWFLHAV